MDFMLCCVHCCKASSRGDFTSESFHFRMEDEKVVAICLAVYALEKLKKKPKKRRKRSIWVWVKPYLAERHTKSNFQLVEELQRFQDKEEYRAYLRMDSSSFTVSSSLIHINLYTHIGKLTFQNPGILNTS